MNKWTFKVYKFLASLKLAVIVILSLAVISAVGTVVESRYDTVTAQKLVYHSWYMYLVMVLLIVNLVFSAVERLPWKRRHVGFVTAHTGIIVLILGSYITHKRGIDGSMIMNIGESSRYVSLPGHTDLIAYTTIDGDSFKEEFFDEVEFLVSPPSSRNPYEFKVSGETVKVVDYLPYAVSESRIEESDLETEGPALRVQLKNDQMNVVEWILQDSKSPASLNLGPAELILSKDDVTTAPKGNAVVIKSLKDKDAFQFFVYTESKGGLTKRGRAKIGDSIALGWMNIELRVMNIYSHAHRKTEYRKLDKPTPMSTSAMKLQFRDQEYWLGLNSVVKLFADNFAIILSYGYRKVDLGFNLKLMDFQVGRYPGSMMAMAYESKVEVTGMEQQQVISMNEPLKYRGFTFYQASFQEDVNGKPIASVLSVNDDPGRMIKYFGSFLILLGTIILFYFKKRTKSVQAHQPAEATDI